MNKSVIPVMFFFLFLFCGCSYDYFSPREKRKVKSVRTTAVVQNQLKQLRAQDSLLFRNGNTVIIHPLMSNKSGTGIYAYNLSMIHFGYVDYFIYRNDSVIRLDRSNQDSLANTVNRFLLANDFSRHKIKVAMKKLKITYAIHVTDVF
jgi:hypothetical protein